MRMREDLIYRPQESESNEGLLLKLTAKNGMIQYELLVDDKVTFIENKFFRRRAEANPNVSLCTIIEAKNAIGVSKEVIDLVAPYWATLTLSERFRLATKCYGVWLIESVTKEIHPEEMCVASFWPSLTYHSIPNE